MSEICFANGLIYKKILDGMFSFFYIWDKSLAIRNSKGMLKRERDLGSMRRIKYVHNYTKASHSKSLQMVEEALIKTIGIPQDPSDPIP